MLFAAIISEIPFDLMYSDTVFYPLHQNVLWTFLIGLGVMYGIDLAFKKYSKLVACMFAVLLTLVGFLVGTVTFVDYYGVGVLMVLTFYFFRSNRLYDRLLQFLCLFVLNVKMLGGYYYEWIFFGHTFEIVQQGFALFALVPIWLYQGKQGYHAKLFQYACYGFYPVHMLLSLLRMMWFASIGM